MALLSSFKLRLANQLDAFQVPITDLLLELGQMKTNETYFGNDDLNTPFILKSVFSYRKTEIRTSIYTIF